MNSQASSLTPALDVPALRVLLIDDGAHHIGLIRDELVRQGQSVVGVIDSARLVDDGVRRLRPDVMIVDSESPSHATLEHLARLWAVSPQPVVVFSDDPRAQTMRQALRAGVNAYVIDGLQPQRLLPIVQMAIARFEQERELRDRLAEAQTQLAERKLIERAKGILMDQFGVHEEQAFRRLRKLAMDRGQRLAQVAERVVDAHQLLRPPD